MVGLNGYSSDKVGAAIPLLKVDEEVQKTQVREPPAREGVARRGAREELPPRGGPWRGVVEGEPDAADHRGERERPTAPQQEICDVLRAVFGTYTDPAEF